MIIPERTVKIVNIMFVTVHTNNLLKVAFPDNFCLTFIDQPQLYEVLSAIASLDVYKYAVPK